MSKPRDPMHHHIDGVISCAVVAMVGIVCILVEIPDWFAWMTVLFAALLFVDHIVGLRRELRGGR